MKLANRAYVVTLILLTFVFAASAQKLSEKDDRNTSPTVGTGGPVGGPTGLFTVYDGKTLRKGEYTLSIAYSNYDRDPGNVDITDVPMSFQLGVSDRLELFFTTNGYRGVKVNSPRNLSGFYLPNSQVRIGGLTSPPAIVLAPQGPGVSIYTNSAVYRPGGMPFSQFPYTGGNAGTYGLQPPFFSGPQFGFGPALANATLGPPRVGGAADLFPGIGSPYGGILPGVVLATVNLGGTCAGSTSPTCQGPSIFTVAPSYLPDMPFLNRIYGTSAFGTMDFGFKWRFNNPSKAIGYGVIATYRWYPDTADGFSGFNQMQRGSGAGGNKGDINVTLFTDARLATWANLSANIGYNWTSKAKGTFGGTSFILLDRPDELQAGIGLDFPVNKHFQPILEFRSTHYISGRTPNAFERDPIDGLAGFKFYPRRWFGFGFAYRINFNQQDVDSFDNSLHTTSVALPCRPGVTGCQAATIINTFSGVPQGFATSTDPHGYMAQFWVGRRDTRAGDIINQAPSVDSVTISDTVITLPCRPGTRSASGACNDSKTVSVTTKASDPENDVLTYNYTVSGGRVVGSGANVQWDLSGAQAGTYTITTGVDDGCGVCGKTDTKTIRVEECPDCKKECDCSPLSVSGPSGITQPAESMTFTASVSGDVTYNWTVSNGTITSGQGTPSITVGTTREMKNSSVTATVQIGGTPEGCNCQTTGSATGDIAGPPTVSIVDEFGKMTDDDVKARVDGFYTTLGNNPTAQGYIINYGSAADIKKRRAQIMKAINFKKYDPSRVTFVDGPDNGGGVNTKFFIVPAGADNPQP